MIKKSIYKKKTKNTQGGLHIVHRGRAEYRTSDSFPGRNSEKSYIYALYMCVPYISMPYICVSLIGRNSQKCLVLALCGKCALGR
jgi:hypothetical protein